ncbi:MAG: hypothetical protein LBK25_07505 [Treponema sp.]|jgi:hypothetical protein|nr:hypothetical protein [Treponema sp.]
MKDGRGSQARGRGAVVSDIEGGAIAWCQTCGVRRTLGRRLTGRCQTRRRRGGEVSEAGERARRKTGGRGQGARARRECQASGHGGVGARRARESREERQALGRWFTGRCQTRGKTGGGIRRALRRR